LQDLYHGILGPFDRPSTNQCKKVPCWCYSAVWCFVYYMNVLHLHDITIPIFI
jgi:hypothetical protein